MKNNKYPSSFLLLVSYISCFPRKIWHIFDVLAVLLVRVKKTDGVCVVRTGGLGDIVLLIPLLRSLRDSRTTLILPSRHSSLEFILKNYVDTLVYVDERKFRKNVLYRIRLLREVRGVSYSLLIHAGISRQQGDSDTICWAVSAKAKTAFESRSKLDCESLISDAWFIRLIDAQYGVLHELDRLKIVADLYGDMSLYNFHRKIRKVESSYLLFSIDASTPVREWGVINFKILALMLWKKLGLNIIFYSSNNREEELNDIINGVSLRYIWGTPLQEFCDYISNATLLICNESGPMHLGVFFSVPTVAIVSGGDYSSYCHYPADYFDRLLIVSQNDKSCFNCLWSCKFKKMDSQPFPCLSNLSPDYVFKNLCNWLVDNKCIEVINE